MEKLFKIIGVVVVLWIALMFVLWILGNLLSIVFWIAIIVGVAYIVATFVMKKGAKRQ